MEFFVFVNFVLLIVLLAHVGKINGRIRSMLTETEIIKGLLRIQSANKTSSVKVPKAAPVAAAAEQPVAESSVAPAVAEAESKEEAIKYHEIIATQSVAKKEVASSVEVTPPPLPEKKESTSEKVAKYTKALASTVDTTPVAPKPVTPPKEKRSIEEQLPSWAGRMWNWFLVGKEYRPVGMPIEFAVASIWMLRVAVVALVMGMGFFLNMSSDQPFLGGEYGRISLAFLIGTTMLGSGLFLLGKKFNLNGEGLVGGGLLILYFCCYAAGPRYDIIDPIWAFALMGIITVASGVISVKVNSLMIAVIGLIGGYASPHMLPTGVEQLPLFYSYIILLSIGVWLVVRVRPWQILLYSSFICSYALILSSLSGTTPEMFGMVMGFVTVIFAIYATMVYVHNIHNEKDATVAELLHVVLNALVYAGIGYWLIERAFPKEAAAVLSISLAAFYIAQVWTFLQMKINQRMLLMVLLALAAGFVVWTLPLLLKNGSLTIGFAILAFMFLWLGQKLNSKFLKALSYGLYFFTFFRMIGFDLDRSYGHGLQGTADGFMAYFKVAIGRLMTFGVPAASTLAASRLLRNPCDSVEITVDEYVAVEADEHPVLGDLFQWAVALLIFIFMLLEFNDFLSDSRMVSRPVLTLIWCSMAAYCLFRFIQGEVVRWWIGGVTLFFVIGSVLKLLVYDANQCGLDGVLYSAPYTMWECFSRFTDFSFVIGLLFLGAWVLRSKRPEVSLSPFFGYGGLALLLLYQTLEIRSLLDWKLVDFVEGGTSVLWALNAIIYIIIGMIKSRRGLRFIGLGMFVVVVLKVFVVDLQDMPLSYRVVALVVVGVLMMIGSFIYVFSSGKFTIAEPEETDEIAEK